jgi:hypothetical protein
LEQKLSNTGSASLLKNVKWARAELTAECIESPDRADALIGAIVLGAESQVDWKEAMAVHKEIKHQMQLDYLRTGRGRPHIEWRW